MYYSTLYGTVSCDRTPANINYELDQIFIVCKQYTTNNGDSARFCGKRPHRSEGLLRGVNEHVYRRDPQPAHC